MHSLDTIMENMVRQAVLSGEVDDEKIMHHIITFVEFYYYTDVVIGWDKLQVDLLKIIYWMREGVIFWKNVILVVNIF